MRASLLAELNAERDSRRASVLITEIGTGAQRLVRDREVDGDPLAVQLREQLRLGRSALVEIGDTTYFLRVRVPRLRMVVVGAVHVAQGLIPIAHLAGYEVTVIDPRSAFATPQRFADCELIVQWPQDAFAARPLDRYTAMVVLSHVPEIDDEGIKAALASDCFYVGALGSRKTNAARLERLRKQNIHETELARIHAPVGLDIGAVGATEIAIAIVAEVIAARRQKPLRSEQAA